jgi:non-ribosomal peptide synthetase component E (peptide arylation enzyme)
LSFYGAQLFKALQNCTSLVTPAVVQLFGLYDEPIKIPEGRINGTRIDDSTDRIMNYGTNTLSPHYALPNED